MTVQSLLFHLREGSCLAPWKVYLFVINERIVVLQVRIGICRNKSTTKERQVDQDDLCNMVQDQNGWGKGLNAHQGGENI